MLFGSQIESNRVLPARDAVEMSRVRCSASQRPADVVQQRVEGFVLGNTTRVCKKFNTLSSSERIFKQIGLRFDEVNTASPVATFYWDSAVCDKFELLTS